MMDSGFPLCSSCGKSLGFSSPSSGDVFVACNGCNYSICRLCMDEELRESRESCLRCGEPYVHVGGKEPLKSLEYGEHVAMSSHLQDEPDGVHARNLSSLSMTESELNDYSGNPIWKNRVQSWKEKKNKKSTARKEMKRTQVPLEQQMEGKEYVPIDIE